MKQFFFAIICALSLNVSAQDVHFSYYQFAPSVINPALTGAFYGNLRATVHTRGQWTNVRPTMDSGNDGFTTLSVLVDGNIPFGLKKGDWISAGINLVQEGNTAGIVDLKRSFTGISAAYHMTMGKKNPSILTFGVKYGKYGVANATDSQTLSPNNLITGGGAGVKDGDEEFFLGQTAGGGQDNSVVDDTNDFHFGLMYTTPVGKNSDLRIGVSSDHLLAPRLEAKEDPTNMNPQVTLGDQIRRRINVFAQYYTDLSDKVTLNPSIVYQKMGAANNILLQSLLSYQHNPDKDLILNFGLGVRLASNMDVPIYLGADFKDWRVGLAFDTNVTGLTQATGNAGAFELGISKIFSWNKKAKVKPKFICPRL